MKRFRFVYCLGFFLASLFSPPSTVPSAAADSAAPDSTAAPDSFLTIYPVKGERFEAAYVSSWSMETIRYRKVSGETGYLTANKIRSIEDAGGIDRLDSMLRERSSFGVSGPDQPHSLSAWLEQPFRTTPHRLRSGYVVLELGASARASGSRMSTGNGNGLFMTGIGGIKNLSPEWGLGGVVQFISDGDQYRAGAVGVRLRHYLSNSYTIETTQGIFDDSNGDGRRGRGIPYFGEVAISAAGTVSLFSRIERHDYTITQYRIPYYSGSSIHTIEISETALHFGVRLGPRPSYLTVPAFVAGSLLALAPGDRRVY